MLQVESAVPNDLLLTPNGKHTSRSGHVVEEIRKRFISEEWTSNKDLYDEIDVDRMRNSEWFVKRFLLAARRNPDEAYEMMKTTLAWRKNVAISSTPINAFPMEFFQIGGLFQYEPDKQGNPVIFMRIRMHRKINELREPIQQFLFYIINKVDLESDGNGAVILFDCSGAGYANMDIDMLKVLTEVAFKYFPFCIKYVIVYELSWMLNAFRRIAMSIIPSAFAKIVHFANKDDITNFIATENLPDFMGGTCKRDYRKIPEGCPQVETVALERGFTLKDVDRIKSIFKPYLDEAEMVIAAQKAQEQNEIKLLDQYSSTEQTEEIANQDETEQDHLLPGSVAIIRAKSKSFEKYASLYPQNEVHFRSTSMSHTQWPNTSNGQLVLSGTILLRNNHSSKPLAFKVLSTNADQYSVTPNQGVILSGAFVCITLTLKSHEKSYSINEDKFMILLCPEVTPDRDLVNWRQFGKLFVERGDKVFSHRLKARLLHDNAEFTDGTVPRQRQDEVVQLEKEVGKLKRRCGRLQDRQKWFNLAILLLMCLTLLMVAFHWNFDSSWTYLANWIGPMPSVGPKKRQEL